MKPTTWLVTTLMALAAHNAAATWALQEEATYYGFNLNGTGWSVQCPVHIRGVGRDTILDMGRSSMDIRYVLGEDIYRPIVQLAGDASNGELRPAENSFNGLLSYQQDDLSQECVYNTPIELEGDYDWIRDGSNDIVTGTTVPVGGSGCKNLGVQYRITYSLGEGTSPWPRREAWVYNTTYRSYNEEGRLAWTSARVYWLDYPDDLFDTDETKTLRINMTGSRDRRQMRNTNSHIRNQSIIYSRGTEMLRLQRACIDRHVAGGRILLPPYEEPSAGDRPKRHEMPALRPQPPIEARPWNAPQSVLRHGNRNLP